MGSSVFPLLTVGDSNQEDLCGRPVSEHNYRGCQAVLWPVWEGESCLGECVKVASDCGQNAVTKK